MESEQIICQIKELCASVTEHTYDDILRQGYERLTMLHHMGQSQEQVYQPLADYFMTDKIRKQNWYMALLR